MMYHFGKRVLDFRVCEGTGVVEGTVVELVICCSGFCQIGKEVGTPGGHRALLRVVLCAPTCLYVAGAPQSVPTIKSTSLGLRGLPPTASFCAVT